MDWYRRKHLRHHLVRACRLSAGPSIERSHEAIHTLSGIFKVHAKSNEGEREWIERDASQSNIGSEPHCNVVRLGTAVVRLYTSDRIKAMASCNIRVRCRHKEIESESAVLLTAP